MANARETQINLEQEPPRHPQRSVPESSEAAYERLAAYGFARRYVGGEVVANIGRQELGYGTRLLAETAESVTGLSGTPEALDLASTVYSAPNVGYRRVDLPKLPYPEGHFGVVVAFGTLEELEYPEELLEETKRVLKEGGVLLLSARDKLVEAEDGRLHEGEVDSSGQGGIYVPELREMLERHFGRVHVYRQGAVAGGFVFPDTEQEGTADGEVVLEIARFSSAETGLARFGAAAPRTRSIIAVCCEEALERGERQEGSYLLLGHDRGVFEENEDLVEDVELMLGEIEQMQQTEVQAFVEAIRIQRQQNLSQLQMRYLFHIRSYLGHRRAAAREDALHLRNVILENVLHRRNIIYGNIHALREKGVKGSLRGAHRRLSGLYRRLIARDGNRD